MTDSKINRIEKDKYGNVIKRISNHNGIQRITLFGLMFANQKI